MTLPPYLHLHQYGIAYSHRSLPVKLEEEEEEEEEEEVTYSLFSIHSKFEFCHGVLRVNSHHIDERNQRTIVP
jgi:hypothetical protein